VCVQVLLLLGPIKRRLNAYNAAPLKNTPPKLQRNNTSPFSKVTVFNQMSKVNSHTKNYQKPMPSKQQIYFSDTFTIKNLRTVGSFEDFFLQSTHSEQL
jgi:hypothetical protein